MEASVDVCPTCGAPWPNKAGHVVIGSAPCHGCSGARYGTHRTRTCLSCGWQHFDAPCDRLDGASKVHRLPPGWPNLPRVHER